MLFSPKFFHYWAARRRIDHERKVYLEIRMYNTNLQCHRYLTKGGFAVFTTPICRLCRPARAWLEKSLRYEY